MAATVMSKFRNDDLGKLIIRLAVGGMMLLHGIAKVRSGVGGIEGLLQSKGLPTFLAYGAYVGEVIAPVLILLGLLTRPAGAVMAFNMVVAIALAHSGDVFKLDDKTGAWVIESAMFYLLGGLALVFLGAGKYSVSRGKGSWD